ncbi:coproporphyrinogen III oxidase, anaerobic [Trichormus variabilis ATCC 29413]|uniref:Coproporphyrinogen-III oxidase n=2 Tax=Anabaena variabilis TaxID=264691 RepID=Q3M4U5_TRIV2|nr:MULTISPECIES: oxygen-independent coproporphyrinogen III oxidase [Nostocaceae]ABA23991.1 coproporphyrinogen III oxidase, anaerobic [Trichormus variabilis ATCC 29413]MBC1216042.1 oxygen-independent coproporphyrinogen III oxidase [Trichormus variabilis ARAD]MBC1255939.1 oxygen-independent coproporphyrinogen III oxidase [Trichormus variabilis V5]MBC1267943.1 oxygen-independent coproporphyrinogen III oxidase [Trichormus variabilis FSR]MBC1304565.1 oxygen-independent coproporphyrinogen III oxidas
MARHSDNCIQEATNIKFDANLLRKYDQPLPRYTSYPPATELRENFEERHFTEAIAIGNDKKTPISLYCHIPFCESACYFCGCNTVITQKKSIVEPYLNYLNRNIRQVANLTNNQRTVQQLHWGGGTPNYLSLPQVESLWQTLNDCFRFDENAEISIEVNPRFLTREYLFFLRDLGFNRISFGIQDFNFQVQQAVNRIQPEEMLFQVMDWMRDAGFASVNVDLIYGLPYQTLETFKSTVDKTIQLNPDRIAVFNFAYVPWLKPVQHLIPPAALPSSPEKLDILQMTIEKLTSHGYVFIGMDHFAKPNDELAIAQQNGKLHRNFQGYTTKPESDLLGFGMSSISMLHDVYVQNHKRLKNYYQGIDSETLPIEKGVKLNQDDIIRRTIIMELMCQFQLSPENIQEKYDLSFDSDFSEYFFPEKLPLQLLAADGLIRLFPDHIEVTPAGRLLIRNIAAVFDAYLQKSSTSGFSKAI